MRNGFVADEDIDIIVLIQFCLDSLNCDTQENHNTSVKV